MRPRDALLATRLRKKVPGGRGRRKKKFCTPPQESPSATLTSRKLTPGPQFALGSIPPLPPPPGPLGVTFSGVAKTYDKLRFLCDPHLRTKFFDPTHIEVVIPRPRGTFARAGSVRAGGLDVAKARKKCGLSSRPKAPTKRLATDRHGRPRRRKSSEEMRCFSRTRGSDVPRPISTVKVPLESSRPRPGARAREKPAG
jgi:hypothetical protein